jgi:hypothetical protein
MRRLAIVAAVAALLAMAMPAEGLASTGQAGRCVNGWMAAGTYSSFVVRGNCTIAGGATVHIRGNLMIAPGAALDDHGAEQWMHGEIHVGGDVLVGPGAVLGLGWNSPNGEGSLGPDTVGGSIVAFRPRALQIGELTIGRNLISVGGGVASTSAADFRNFPVKDNVIGGNLVVTGWHGGWIGLIRNTVARNVVFSYNVSMSSDAGPGTDSDSSEVMGTHIDMGGGQVVDIPQTIGGNLICLGNLPAAQINPGDGGAPNSVGGHAIGQCKGLTH